MQSKTINPFTVLYYSERVTYATLLKLVRVVARDLHTDAVNKGLEVVGPVYWIYYGVDADPNKEFLLEIALPVTPADVQLDKFQMKSVDTFKCMSYTHYGDWAKLSEVYGKCIPDIFAQGGQLSGQNREIYIHMDFAHPENNITEVQIGVL